jgi:type II secretion system protein G
MFISKNNKKQPTHKFALAPRRSFSGVPRDSEAVLRGFTLIELLVVIVIIGILATVTMVALNGSRANARDAKRVSDLKQIANSVEMYYADHNAYPTYTTAGVALKSADGVKTYMTKVPADPSTNLSYAYGGNSNFTLRAILEKGASELPAGNIIITNKSGVKLPVNTDARLVDDALTFGGALVGHWALDGNTGATDLSGNGNTGTSVGGVSQTVGRFGESTGAYYYNGSGHVLIGSNITIFNNLISGNMTLSAWVKTTSGGHVISHENCSNANNYYLSVSSLTPRFLLVNSAATPQTVVSSITAQSDVWTHVVAKKEGSTSYIYVNGVSGGSLALSGTFTSNTNTFAIGDRPQNTNVLCRNYFNGSITDARVYSRALSDAEVLQLYNATKP